jgi:hypothetical protein
MKAGTSVFCRHLSRLGTRPHGVVASPVDLNGDVWVRWASNTKSLVNIGNLEARCQCSFCRPAAEPATTHPCG